MEQVEHVVSTSSLPETNFLFNRLNSTACNLGYVYRNLTYIEIGDPCIDAATNLDRSVLDDCTCCDAALIPSKYLLLAYPYFYANQLLIASTTA
jgi:hypothetical protein